MRGSSLYLLELRLKNRFPIPLTRKTSALNIKGFSLPAAAAALLAMALVAASTSAQAPPPETPQAGAPAQPARRPMPKPTNLKVLPSDMTGEQVMEIMHGFEAQLGAECSTCHAADPTKIGPNGKPRLNFADDSKKEKATARLMMKMTEDINKNYISMVENSGVPVKCGTCHRGKVTPEQFVPKPDHDDHHDHDDHDHPAPPPAHPGTR